MFKMLKCLTTPMAMHIPSKWANKFPAIASIHLQVLWWVFAYCGHSINRARLFMDKSSTYSDVYGGNSSQGRYVFQCELINGFWFLYPTETQW
jgi:hypothetical protein